MMADEITRIARRLSELRDASASPGFESATTHYPAFVGKVIGSPSAGTGVGRYVTVRPVTILGSEIEGGTASLVEDASTSTIVYTIGSRVPKTGDALICRFIENRWVAHLGGKVQSTRGQMIGCACATPPINLQMSVSGTVCANGLLNSCTLSYRATPSELGPLHLGNSSYLSTEMFPDPQTGDLFYYYLGCFSSIIRISRVFPNSIYGSPFLDSVVYFWTIGLPGNTCNPFLLSNGQIFFGGDPSCHVTISE